MTGASPVERFFHPVCPAAALRKKPRRVQLAGERYVLFRGARGVVGALPDACPHRHAPLSAGSVVGGELRCPYHGWRFQPDGRGASPTQPSLKRCDTRAFAVREAHGYLWLGGSEAATMPALRWDDYDFVGHFSAGFAAPLSVCLDNFSEDEHTPWVHTRLGWTADRAQDVQFRAENHPDHTEVHYSGPQRWAPVAYLLGLRPGDRFHNDWTTHFDPVRTVYDISWRGGADDRTRPIATRSVIFFVPQTETETELVTFVFLKKNPRLAGWARALIGKLACRLGQREVQDDQAFIRLVADTDPALRGMRLGRYDKPLIHNHRLLDALYWQRRSAPHLRTVAGSGES